MKLYTRVTPEEVWPGYWNIILSIRGNYNNGTFNFGDCGFELACQINGDDETLVATRKQMNGTWSSWKTLT